VLLVTACAVLGLAVLILLVGAEVLGKTPLDRDNKIRAVGLDNVLNLLHEVLHGAPAEGNRLHSAMNATLAGFNETDLGLTLGEVDGDGVLVGIAAVLAVVHEGHVSGLRAELETVAHLKVSMTVTDNLPDKRGRHR